MRTGCTSFLRHGRWIFVLFMLLIASTINTANAATYAPSQTMSVKDEIPGLGTFVGFWRAHSASIRVQADGQAHFEARVYTWCGPGVKPPCDKVQEETIISGYQENAQFSRVSNNVAYGTITSGNMQRVGSAVTLTLQSGGQVLYSGTGSILCGPSAAVAACGA